MIAAKKLRLAVNAGASDPEKLAAVTQELCAKLNCKLKVAWVSGDDVIEQVGKKLATEKEAFYNIDTGQQLENSPFKPVAAQAYLGAFGVAKAFECGADIVICGRVADASTTMGAAIWWHCWNRDNLPQLASALIAGHLIECSTYVTGANFSGFKTIPRSEHPGLPIAEIGADGSLIITKTSGSGGAVTAETVKAQLLYEIQGPWYVYAGAI